ncbi:AraC family transcriptional regulator [Sphingobacterium rhinopitheci]|uniref:AraC family transcriptional regulator n=1 Tax=Sphingobacterium rhinopitheci TaxID=2781960 RepID=UPI001F5211C0|nr:AraC family transcriptional regulator [Sphingobacterium rhinopitheci]MCI0922010.1 helix-turn-helix domain-containing protein [Sphingobacterium rhinopitheci]
MRPKQLINNKEYHNSFTIRHDIYPQHHNSWHYHEQLELVWIAKGAGSLYLGDAIKDFSEDTCVLIGANIPHFWLFHTNNTEENSPNIDCVVIHFNNDFAGKDLFNIPELHELKILLQKAEKGLISHKAKSIATLFEQALTHDGISKFISLIEILKNFSSLNLDSIVSNNYSTLNSSNDEQRMRNVMGFIRDNYKLKIELQMLANEAKMTKNSFCRYFKQKTGKSPTSFINELKVAHACRCLKNTDMSLKEICFESGFNNFVSFHKVFKSLINMTPIHFKTKYTAY